jgi:hypothetical protein
MEKFIHVLAAISAESTGWCSLKVPRLCIFGDEPSEITEWDYGAFSGYEPDQAIGIARLAREMQSLAYKTGPALIVKPWDYDPLYEDSPLAAVRIGAMLLLLQRQGKLGDSTITAQVRTVRELEEVNDDRLRKLHMYVANDQISTATKHAIVALRRAKETPEFAAKLWPYCASSL